MPGSEASEAKQLNADAQARFAEGNYAAAAAAYARIFEVLPENRINREERDNTLLISLEVYREAYRQRRSGGGEEAVAEAAEFLCQGKRLYDKYAARYRDVYGGGAEPSLEATKSMGEVRDLIAEADAALGRPACEPQPASPPPPPPPKPTRPPITPITVNTGPSGVGLIVAGSVTIAVGLGTTGMIIAGAQMVKRADEDRNDAMTDAERNDADDRGRTGNALIISGSILTGVLLAGGATMLGIGIRRRMRYLAFTPQMNRGYVGVSLRGRF